MNAPARQDSVPHNVQVVTSENQTMQEIDLRTWPRREHFAFFRRADLPFYNITANIDVSGLRAFAKKNALSLNSVLIHLTTRTLNSIENFRYRCRDESVILHEQINPSFAYLREGEELFRFITVDYHENLVTFDQVVKAAIADSAAYFDLTKLAGRDDFVFISALPWIAFTAVDHTLSLKKDDGVPRVTWGKLILTATGDLLPFNIQVNHMFVDGLHVGRFFDALAANVRLLV